MNILVYGAGVLGSLYAAKLHQAGHRVAILARGQRLSDLHEHGIVLEEHGSGRITTTRVRVVEALDNEDNYDLIIVLMRKDHVAGILPILAANKYSPNILFMTNNAAGPRAYIEAVGEERVLLGFPGAGGTKDNHKVRYLTVSSAIQKTTIGELSGEITDRLLEIEQALAEAGFGVTLSPNIDAWLRTHVALVSPIANALYAAGGDIYRLANTRDALVLMIRAMREGFLVLRAHGYPVTPRRMRVIQWLPEPLLVLLASLGFSSKRAELAIARHANAARDEMRLLAEEFQTMARQTLLATPALDQLAVYVDPNTPPLPEGCCEMPLNWRKIWAGLGVVSGVGLVTWLQMRQKRA